MTPLQAGRAYYSSNPLRYLIGGDDSYAGAPNEITELSYDAERPPAHGVGIKYGNLFNEKYSEQSAEERASYGPYLQAGDTAEEYGEGQIDPAGQGWNKNLDEQFARALAQGFGIIELDNADSYNLPDVLGAVDRAHNAGLMTVAKNPGLMDDPVDYVGHPAVIGIIVERDAGTPTNMDGLRRLVSKPELPVWFVAFGDGRSWADRMATQITAGGYVNMGVTYSSSADEYGNSVDVLVPVPPLEQEEEERAVVTVRTKGNVRVIVNGKIV